ncbi:MAG: hypothetical protein EP332_02115 [Bacteroidetes bacterium]|nr:MAG: hypothetical protein EP332_02115 [Bacteroidota bacterium]
MKFLVDYLKGLLISLLQGIALFSLVFVFIRGIFSVGTKASQLLMYKEVIYSSAWIYAALCLFACIVGNLSLLYLRKKDLWLGYNLGTLIQAIYLIALFQFLNSFWMEV